MSDSVKLTRRVLAVFLPDLSCELAARDTDVKQLPLATCQASEREPVVSDGDVLCAVNEPARRLGIRRGQTVAEARAIAAHLVVRPVTTQDLCVALGRIAEVAQTFGTTVAIAAGNGGGALDTVWVDLTGAAHLHNGEEATLLELRALVGELGHRVRAAVADGPRLARAAAVFATHDELIVRAGEGRAMMSALPLDALPLTREHVIWLNRLGLWTVGELTSLPNEAVGSRLGQCWREARALAYGEDDAPLVAYEPAPAPSEATQWEEGITSVEPLLFSLRALTSRLSARLMGRGQAAQSLELCAPFDRSIALLRGITSPGGEAPCLRFQIDVPSPLARKEDLFRVFKSKLENTTIDAPLRGVQIVARTLTRATSVQLSLTRQGEIHNDPKSLAVLLAELAAEVGSAQLGVLTVANVHRPEERTKLVPIRDLAKAVHGEMQRDQPMIDAFPSRLLKKPLRLAALPAPSATLSLEHHLFTVASVKHAMRIDCVEWWKAEPVCRDYLRVWLTAGRKNVEAWVYRDRRTGRAYLHGFFD